MSSETDHPRQRTVAELLAAHGDGNASSSGRRRRRRDDDPEEPEYGAPAGDGADYPPPSREPRRAAPDDARPPAQRESGRRRAGAEPEWPADQRNGAPRAGGQRAAEQRPPEQRPADPWGVDEPGADDWASERWDGGQWDEDQWDGGRREAPGRDGRPAAEQWGGPVREAPRYGEQEPREAPTRRSRRQPEELDGGQDAQQWESREQARAWEQEPRRVRDRDAPAWEPRAAEPEPYGREPRGREAPARAPRSWDEPDAGPGRGARGEDEAPGDAMLRDRPTEQMPQVRPVGGVDPAATSRIQQQRRRPEPDADEYDDGPATMVGAAPVGAEAWHRNRTDGRRRPPEPDDGRDADEGPPTMVGGAPAGAEAWHRDRTDGRRRDADGGPPTQASAPMSFDDDDDDYPGDYQPDYPAGLDRNAMEEPTGLFTAEDGQPDAPAARRPADEDEDEAGGGGPAWAAVIAQWIAGAIGGAALWVGFRFLWRDLPVVALAAAVLVTVGLVVVVRALLRSSDLRTTLFAVLVGLLLTVSPAILVLLGR